MMVKKLVNHNWVGLNEKNVVVGNKILKVYQPMPECPEMEVVDSGTQQFSSNTSDQPRRELQKSLSFI